MPYTVIVHVAGEEAVVGELLDLPGATDTSILITKVRRRDGKAVHYLAAGVDTVIWPMNRVTFLEILPVREARDSAAAEAEGPAAAEVTRGEPEAPPPPAPPPPAPPPAETAEEGPPVAQPGRSGGLLAQRAADQAGQARPAPPRQLRR